MYIQITKLTMHGTDNTNQHFILFKLGAIE